jgi:hypothetical protein
MGTGAITQQQFTGTRLNSLKAKREYYLNQDAAA